MRAEIMKKPNDLLINDEDWPFVVCALTHQINRFDAELGHSKGWRDMRPSSIALLTRLLEALAPQDDISSYIIQQERLFQ